MPRSCFQNSALSVLLSLGSVLGLSSSEALGSQDPGSGPPPTPVRAIRVELRETQAREAVTGSLRAAQDADLAAREEGAVMAVLAREGRFVRKGEPIVELDMRRLAAQRTGVAATLAEAEAASIRAGAEADDADQDLAALEAAAKRGSAVSDRELRRARTLAKSLRAGFAASEKRTESLAAELALWDLRITDATLSAPFDGTVVEIHVEVGEWVSPGTPLVRLVSTGHIEVWLDLPERLMASLAGITSTGGAAGAQIEVSAGGRSALASQVRSVPRVNPGTRTFPLIATLAGDDTAGLSPGMSASAWIPVGELRATLMVPKDSLVYRPAGVAVMTVAGRDEGGATVGGMAAMVPVKVLFESESEVAVEVAEGGLQPGAVVIVEGNERLFPGTPVSASIKTTTAEGSKPGERQDAKKIDGPSKRDGAGQ